MSAASRNSGAARPAAVLWDMDGTLVDTEPYWIATEYALVAEHGGHWSDDHARSLVGFDLRDAAAVLRDRGGVDLPIDDIVNRLLDGVIERVQQKVPWRPGARALLIALRKQRIPCALVTMSWSRFADAVVGALPPGSFDVVITGDEVIHGKPHPEPYLAAAAALGVRAQDCVAIEDSPTGVRSAVAAGCRTFAVPNVVDVPEGRGYTVVGSLNEIDRAALGLPAESPASRRPASRRPASPYRTRRILAAVVTAAAIAAGVIVATSGDDPPPLENIPISGWAPYWVLGEATASVAAHGSVLHEVSPFWYAATGVTAITVTGNIEPSAMQALIDTARATGTRVLPSIVDGLGKTEMATLLANPTSRALHVQTIVDLVASGGFDGIDLDYEGFAFVDDYATWETTRPNWVAFVTELATALHAQGKLLTVSVPPIYDTKRTADSGRWVYDYAAMGEVVDRIRIMGYDYSFDEPGPIAPINWLRGAIRAAKKAVDDDSKLVLGIPLYGRNWVVGTIGNCPADAEGTVPITHSSAEELIAKREATPVPDETNKEVTFTYQLVVTDAVSTCTQAREVHYVDEAGSRARLDLAREERIGGVAFWALGFDSPATWASVAGFETPKV
ncbi:MAG: HAD-IA family hydrolase [Actinomycetia bacterium]|nr:HAD-IA family hydrolase [Actinomycetes bacterium]